MKFFLMMLLSSAMFVACGDDVDTEFVKEVVDQRVGDIERTSSDGIILDAEDVFGGDSSVDQAIEETIRDARNGDFDLDIDELSSSIDFPVVSDYLDDYRLAFYDLHYQCFERGNSRSSGTIESRRDGNRQLSTNNFRSSHSRTATGCNVVGVDASSHSPDTRDLIQFRSSQFGYPMSWILDTPHYTAAISCKEICWY